MNYLERFIGATAPIQSKRWGPLLMEVASFTPATDGDLVVHIGKPFEQPNPLIRIHSECVFSEVFNSDLCECADQLMMAMERLVSEGHGLLFYLRFDGRGAGLAAKVAATKLEVEGMDTYDSRVAIGVAPEGRDFRAIGEYLHSRGINQVRLLTNNPVKVAGLLEEGITVTREPLVVADQTEKVRKLLETKASRFGHQLISLEFPSEEQPSKSS
ncbi:MAG TPA: hypothetical protein VGE45_07760 [Chloroflexia bacterium]|jgi:GTP cyclohydrolase II